ncbi:hypothetical protein BS50DRAFT_559422 [Corynespora cassiicola Philippines]|uniref:T6SS Phospholipase effector Tle1-like catalytic domain-containing protein n=1 Tax=Corynespora cassiicola Philippines TaxID=1448308 RepID=A0A2T2ND81_CORCC|nr:hypothetical protein BS50DRAFT_559422 [Corynespora cassiicola Philippines]
MSSIIPDERPWGRRLIICCDGTWQSSVSAKENVPSNVTRLCRLIARIGEDKHNPNKKWHQIVYYDSGIGTGNLSSSERRRQGGTGAGLAENVIEAYNFIVMNYEAGDEIFCFGFSRGAYTARAVAGLVSDIGVIKPIDMQVFPQIYRAYKQNEEGLEFRETQAWKDFVYGKLSERGRQNKDGGPIDASAIGRAQSWEIPPHGKLDVDEESRRVKVVGVWDTVGSLGVPDVGFLDFASSRTKYGFHNVKLNEHIEHAFHALALDERRKAFRPTLWYIPKGLKKELEAAGKPIPELKQVWFPGVHINCGGGSDDAIAGMKGDLEHLSTTTFTWMLQCVEPYLTIDKDAFKESMLQYQGWLDKVRYACTYHHETWLDWTKSKLPKVPIINPRDDPLAPPKRDPAHQHPKFDYGWGTGEIVDSYSGIYYLSGFPLPRVPGHCSAEVYNEEDKEYKLQDICTFGETNEYIHPICRYRDIIRGSEVKSTLKGFTRKWSPTQDGKGRYWWYKNGDHEPTLLPEWIILPHDDDINFERAWYEQCEKNRTVLQKVSADLEARKKKNTNQDWLQSLDDENDFGVGDVAGHVYP